MTPTALLLLGLDAAERLGHGGLSRNAWPLRVLLEELRQNVPVRTLAAAAVSRFWDTQLGVSDRAVARSTDELVQAGLIYPAGTGSDARWVVPLSHSEVLQTLWAGLTEAEQSAVYASAQRAHDLSVAWSKTRCA
jgi:hypothetical protein